MGIRLGLIGENSQSVSFVSVRTNYYTMTPSPVISSSHTSISSIFKSQTLWKIQFHAWLSRVIVPAPCLVLVSFRIPDSMTLWISTSWITYPGEFFCGFFPILVLPFAASNLSFWKLFIVMFFCQSHLNFVCCFWVLSLFWLNFLC